MMGLAASPGTAVLPTCSIALAKVAQDWGDSRANCVELLGPLGVVFFDHDGGSHSNCLRNVLQLLLDFGEFTAQAGDFFFECRETVGCGVCCGGRGCPRPIHICPPDIRILCGSRHQAVRLRRGACSAILWCRAGAGELELAAVRVGPADRALRRRLRALRSGTCGRCGCEVRRGFAGREEGARRRWRFRGGRS